MKARALAEAALGAHPLGDDAPSPPPIDDFDAEALMESPGGAQESDGDCVVVEKDVQVLSQGDDRSSQLYGHMRQFKRCLNKISKACASEYIFETDGTISESNFDFAEDMRKCGEMMLGAGRQMLQHAERFKTRIGEKIRRKLEQQAKEKADRNPSSLSSEGDDDSGPSNPKKRKQDESVVPAKQCETETVKKIGKFWICKVCKKRHTDKRTLLGCLKSQTGERMLCPKPGCNEKFSNEIRFFQHCRRHIEGPYICKRCNKEFQSKSSLNKHGDIHAREDGPTKQFYYCKYPGCKRKYVSKQSLKEHVPIHQKTSNKELRPFKCRFCKKRYNTPGSMRQHISTMHRHLLHKNKQ